jgi:hypothetical protein
MRLERARQCVGEMIDAQVPLRDIEQFVRLIDVPEQAKARLLYRAREAAESGRIPDLGLRASAARL